MAKKKISAFAADLRAPDGGDNDQTTGDPLYSDDDIQFMTAMDYYKRDNRRPFPTWSEALEVLHALGYRKVAAPTPMPSLHSELPPIADG